MKKSMIGAIVSLTSVGAFATATRMSVLGTNTVVDETDIFSFPTAMSAKDFVLVELGTASNSNQHQAYGLAKVTMSGNHLAVGFSNEKTLLTSNKDVTGTSLVDAWLTQTNNETPALLPELERPINIIWSVENFGMGLTLASFKNNVDDKNADTSVVNDATQADLTFGFKLPGAATTEFALRLNVIGNLKRESKTGTTVTSSNEYKAGIGKDIQLSARHVDPKSYYLFGDVSMRSPEVKNNTAGKKEDGKLSENMLTLKGGIIRSPIETTNVYTGLSLFHVSTKGPIVANNAPSIVISDDTNSRSTNALMASVALETKVSESFGVLGGMNYNLWGQVSEKDNISGPKQKKTERSVTETSDQVLWSLGLFYAVDKLRFDASYSKGFLYSGPHFVSGNDRGGNAPLFTQLSLSYTL